MSINPSDGFTHYDFIATTATAVMTFIDANRDIWIPKDWVVKLEIYVLISALSLVNGLISYIIYPLFAGSTGVPLGIEALLIGAGYFSLLRVISIKLKSGEGETPELSFSSLIYEPFQSLFFRRIDEIIDPYLEVEIEKLSKNFTLEELTIKVYDRINRANLKVLNADRKNEVKQWLSDTLANNTETNEQIKKIFWLKF